MTTVSIMSESDEKDGRTYRAVAGKNQSAGKTAGEALDALTRQLSEEDTDTLIIVRNMRPDRFFNAQQQQRLEELMARWRVARDTHSALSHEEQTELENLVEAEQQASAERAKALLRELGR
jgi:hypothetical protein